MFQKILTYIKANGATIIDAVQVVVRGLKAVLSAVINLLSIFIPAIDAQKTVNFVRNLLNVVDDFLSTIKAKLVLVV